MICDICETFFEVEQFEGGVCPVCGQHYEYEEGTFPVLDGEHLAAIYKINRERVKNHESKRANRTTE